MAANDPEARSRAASIAANTRWAFTDTVAGTAAARAASPASLDYWERQVDPDHTLAPDDRAARARRLQTAHRKRLAAKSAKARAARKGGGDRAT